MKYEFNKFFLVKYSNYIFYTGGPVMLRLPCGTVPIIVHESILVL